LRPPSQSSEGAHRDKSTNFNKMYVRDKIKRHTRLGKILFDEPVGPGANGTHFNRQWGGLL